MQRVNNKAAQNKPWILSMHIYGNRPPGVIIFIVINFIYFNIHILIYFIWFIFLFCYSKRYRFGSQREALDFVWAGLSPRKWYRSPGEIYSCYNNIIIIYPFRMTKGTSQNRLKFQSIAVEYICRVKLCQVSVT